MFKKIVLMLLLALPLLSCPFDEEDSAVTIDAYKAISKEVKKGDFKKAKEEILKQKELYEYFGKDIYSSLLKGADNKDSDTIKKMLNRSMVLEIKELLDKAEADFNSYKKARLLLIKAKKHLKVLTKDKEPHKLMKQMLKSLGNPGLMGMGKKEADKGLFLKSKESLLNLIN
jgi:hypothetical protein